MLESVRGYIYERRNGLTTAVTFVGGLYLAKHYIQDRLDEFKVKLEQERAAQDRYDIHLLSKEIYIQIISSLRRRFQQTQEDVSYTILALIPTLSEQILDQMNIEALTQELQTRSIARNAAKRQLQVESSSLASSIVDLQDTRSDVESAASHTSTSFDEVNASSFMSHSVLQSWVESSGSHSHSPALSVADSSTASESTSEAHPSESMISVPCVNNENHSVNDSGLVSFFFFSQIGTLIDHSSFSQGAYLAQLPQIRPTHEQKLSYGTKSKCSVRLQSSHSIAT
jgi:peroxin-3